MSMVASCLVLAYSASLILCSRLTFINIWRQHMIARLSVFCLEEPPHKLVRWTSLTPGWCVCIFQHSCHTLCQSTTAWQFRVLRLLELACFTNRLRIAQSLKCSFRKFARNRILISWQSERATPLHLVSHLVWSILALVNKPRDKHRLLYCLKN